MNYRVYASELSGQIKAIPSKSFAHRLAVCRFFAGFDPVSGLDGNLSLDIRATENVLSELKRGGTRFDCGESGSTLRFLIPLLAVLGGDYKLFGHGKLMQRPNDELFRVLGEHGVTCTSGEYVTVSGKLSGGEFRIRGDISSQYVSGLLMALPYLKEDSRIILTTPLLSAPYVDITISVLDKFGVKIIKEQNGYFVKGGQAYCGNAEVEGDWSNAAFFLVGGALTDSGVTLTGLDLGSVQGDKKIIDVLTDCGADITLSNEGITVRRGALKAFDLDAENCPDMVPAVAVLASFCVGVTRIKNIERLRIKESDRVESVIKMLSSFGISAYETDDTIFVTGGKPTSAKVDAYNDHRIAMSAAIMAANVVDNNATEIIGAQCVSKSYPDFFADFVALNGIAERVYNDNERSVFSGDKLKLTVFGASHSHEIGVIAEGLDGIKPDLIKLQKFLDRRKPKNTVFSTKRKEGDLPVFKRGLNKDNVIEGTLEAVIVNSNQRSSDYSDLIRTPRPSHADYVARNKYGDEFDYRGGGKFSGRLTAPICIAGGICKQFLESEGIGIHAFISRIGQVKCKTYDDIDPEKFDFAKLNENFPFIDENEGKRAEEVIEKAASECDSVGGTIDCVITGIPVGVGEYMFDCIESKISALAFAVPAVKGIEFGSGFELAGMNGSVANDAFCVKGDRIITLTNHNGGINGGISNGMPITFRVVIKPTPSISKEQRTVDIVSNTDTTLKIKGRHDACITPRAVPVIEAISAIAIYDLIKGER